MMESTVIGISPKENLIQVPPDVSVNDPTAPVVVSTAVALFAAETAIDAKAKTINFFIFFHLVYFLYLPKSL